MQLIFNISSRILLTSLFSSLLVFPAFIDPIIIINLASNSLLQFNAPIVCPKLKLTMIAEDEGLKPSPALHTSSKDFKKIFFHFTVCENGSWHQGFFLGGTMRKNWGGGNCDRLLLFSESLVGLTEPGKREKEKKLSFSSFLYHHPCMPFGHPTSLLASARPYFWVTQVSEEAAAAGFRFYFLFFLLICFRLGGCSLRTLLKSVGSLRILLSAFLAIFMARTGGFLFCFFREIPVFFCLFSIFPI